MGDLNVQGVGDLNDMLTELDAFYVFEDILFVRRRTGLLRLPFAVLIVQPLDAFPATHTDDDILVLNRIQVETLDEVVLWG